MTALKATLMAAILQLQAGVHLVRQWHGVVISNLKLADADVSSSIATGSALATTPEASPEMKHRWHHNKSQWLRMHV